MRSFRSFVIFGVLVASAIVASMSIRPALATESDGHSIRAYFSLPLGSDTVATQDYQLGLQFRQGLRETASNPILARYDFTVFDFSFNGKGDIGGDIMGVDMVQMFKLLEEPTKLGQNATGGGGNIGLWIAGGAAGAAILCISKTICSDSNSRPDSGPCDALTDLELSIDCRATFRRR